MFAAASITKTGSGTAPQATPQGRHQHANATGSKAGFELATDGVQIYVCANLVHVFANLDKTSLTWSEGTVDGSDSAKHIGPESIPKSTLFMRLSMRKCSSCSVDNTADLLTKATKPLLQVPVWPLPELLPGL